VSPRNTVEWFRPYFVRHITKDKLFHVYARLTWIKTSVYLNIDG
jgi:hypothetical protein